MHLGKYMDDSVVFDKSNRTVDENGFLHVSDCNISKETVNPYKGDEIPMWQSLGLDPDKIYNVYRPGEDLEKAVDTFNGLPLLLTHAIDSAEVPQKDRRVGAVGTDASWSSPYIKASLSIWDKEAQDRVDSGLYRELSCAYRFDPVIESGVFDGQPYDIVMRNIRGNHVALVLKGRAGTDVIVADSAIEKGDSNMAEELTPEQVREKTAKEEFGIDDDGSFFQRLYAKLDEEQDADLAAWIKQKEAEWRAGESKEEITEEAREEIVGDETVNKIPVIEVDPNAVVTAPGAEVADPTKLVMDAALIRRQVKEETLRTFRALTQAAAKVRPLAGEVDPMAFDSAEKIYEYALAHKGYQTKNYNPAAYAGMVDVLLSQSGPKPEMVLDSISRGNDVDEAFQGLSNISVYKN